MIISSALTLKSYPILEKDTVLECFSEGYGRIKLFIRYNQVKKPRFGGLINSLNLVEIEASQKKDFFYLRSIKLTNSFPTIKKDFKKMALAFHFLDVAISLTEQNQENTELFQILQTYLNELDINKEIMITELKSSFYKSVLITEGIRSKTDLLKYNEKKWSKMIEYYTNREVKEFNC